MGIEASSWREFYPEGGNKGLKGLKGPWNSPDFEDTELRA